MRNFSPQSKDFDERGITRKQGDMDDSPDFSDGARYDIPASNIPPNGIAYSENYVVFPKRLVCRDGTKAWSATTLPAVPGRTGYSLTKAAAVVTKTVGTDFSSADVGNYIVYDDGTHERITAYTNVTTVTVENTTAHAASVAAWVRGPINGTFFHKGENKVILHIGQYLYCSEPTTIYWARIYQLGPTILPNAHSEISEMDNYAVLWNEDGLYKVDLRGVALASGYTLTKSSTTVTKTVGTDFTANVVGSSIVYDDGTQDEITAYTNATTITVENSHSRLASTAAWIHGPRVYFRFNCDVPTVLPTSVNKSSTLVYGYKYTFQMLRLTTETLLKDRTTSGVVTEQMSGSLQPNYDFKDFSTTYAARPVGEGSTDYGVLTGAVLANFSTSYDTIAEWAAVTNGQFKITVNGTEKNIQCNFQGLSTWADIASEIDGQLKAAFPGVGITCEWNGGFVFTATDDGGTITVTSTGDAGTDIGGKVLDANTKSALMCDVTNGTLTTPDYTSPIAVNQLTYPTNGGPWTHYGVYRSLNIGKDSVDPIKGTSNPTELFIHLYDRQVVKSFLASKNAGTTVTATAGTFEPEDVGEQLFFTTAGVGYIVTSYTDSSHVEVSDPGSTAQAAQAASLGTQSGFTASQTGTTVTRTAGVTFVAGDVGLEIFWADGKRSVITSYTSANAVEVIPARTIASTGCAYKPLNMTFTDRIRDDYFGSATALYNGSTVVLKQLRPRGNGLSLDVRFFSAMPNCNIGAISGVMLFGAKRGEKVLYHSSIPTYMTYQGGYYNADRQRALFKDRIEHIDAFDGVLAVLCNNSINYVHTNTFTKETIASVASVILVLSGQGVIDEKVGIIDYGSYSRIDTERAIFIGRDMDIYVLQRTGSTFGLMRGLAKNRFQKKIQELTIPYVSCYDDKNGYTFWSET